MLSLSNCCAMTALHNSLKHQPLLIYGITSFVTSVSKITGYIVYRAPIAGKHVLNMASSSNERGMVFPSLVRPICGNHMKSKKRTTSVSLVGRLRINFGKPVRNPCCIASLRVSGKRLPNFWSIVAKRRPLGHIGPLRRSNIAGILIDPTMRHDIQPMGLSNISKCLVWKTLAMHDWEEFSLHFTQVPEANEFATLKVFWKDTLPSLIKCNAIESKQK